MTEEKIEKEKKLEGELRRREKGNERGEREGVSFFSLLPFFPVPSFRPVSRGDEVLTLLFCNIVFQFC